MDLTSAKNVADQPWQHGLEALKAARVRLCATRANGGVRNSERAQARLEKRLDRLDKAIEVASEEGW